MDTEGGICVRIFVCLDDQNGMLFHGRRQSRDRAVVADMLLDAQGLLWAAPFSQKLLGEEATCCEDFLQRAGLGDCCFVEDRVPEKLEPVESVTVYRWNQVYPADLHWTLELDKAPWRLTKREEFPGYSHERITKEVYVR